MYTKIICGLGNNDVREVKRLVDIYASAGAYMFDSSVEMLPFVQSVILEKNFSLDDFKFCVSISCIDDNHGAKMQISKASCTDCGKCTEVCPRGGAHNCIGCMRCKDVCAFGAISFACKGIDWDGLKKAIAEYKVDYIELHASVGDKKRIVNDLKSLCSIFKGDISICISQEYFKNEDLLALLCELREIAKYNSDFVIQADGKAMSGCDNELETTKPCLELGKYLSDNGFRVILSGGVNARTREFVDFPCVGLAYGSYARLIVKDLEYNGAQGEALETAKSLVAGKLCKM